MNNKELGTAFEREVLNSLRNKGYWVHFITPDRRGTQPFDIIAVRDGKALAIECKTLADSEKSFPITRLEENQLTAFDLWEKCGNGIPYVLVKHRGRIITIPYDKLKAEKRIRLV